MTSLRRLNRPAFVLIAVGVLAGGLRLHHLSYPPDRVFDEVYYSKDACLYDGYSWKQCDIASKDEKYWVKTRDEVGSWVHPPLGKWMIAAGEKIYGPTPFGWRISAAVTGTAGVVLTAYLAWLLFQSTVWSAVAGVLLATENLDFVQSRVALLDIFLAFWVVLGFVFLVLDRRWIARRTPEATEDDEAAEEHPLATVSPLWRPWRFAAGAALGASVATKWSGASALAGAIILAFAWERTRRKKAGRRRPWIGTLVRESFGILLAMAAVPAVIYVAAYARYWHLNGIHPTAFWHLQQAMAQFHLTLHRIQIGGHKLTHPYESEPWQWPLLLRPVNFYFQGPGSEILDIGNPVIFWSSIITVPYALIAWRSRRDWRSGLIAVGVLSQWLPWFLVAGRVQFLFYATPIVPLLVLATVNALKPMSEYRRRGSESHLLLPFVSAYVVLSVLAFAYFWPILTAADLSYQQWHSRIWLPGWF